MDKIALKGLIALVLIVVFTIVAVKLKTIHALWFTLVVPMIIGMLDQPKNEPNEH